MMSFICMMKIFLFVSTLLYHVLDFKNIFPGNNFLLQSYFLINLIIYAFLYTGNVAPRPEKSKTCHVIPELKLRIKGDYENTDVTLHISNFLILNQEHTYNH